MILPAMAAADENAEAPPTGDMQAPPDGERPELPEGMEAPEGMEPPEGMELPEGMEPPSGGAPGGFGGSGAVTQGTAATTIEESGDIEAETYTSEGDNENALRVTGDIDVTLSGITVEKTGGATDNTEDSDFYGQNAGLLATDGAAVTIDNATISTNAAGGNAVFAYGEGTTVEISSSTIRTSLNNSGGIHVTGGGTLTSHDLDVETQGASAAAIRSDRGSGTINADGGSYVTNGTGSPAIYSTANISVSNSTLTANNSEALVIEGKNSISLTDCDVTGNMSGTYADDNAENIHNVMLYQSMSGDADEGLSQFTMNGGSLTALSGDMIYVTNTSCAIELSGVELTLANENLLTVSGNESARGWGAAGANGGDCTFVTDAQVMNGLITVDEISSLELTMQNGTAFTGAVNAEKAGGTVNLTMDESSTWFLTADSYVSAFAGTMDNLELNGFTMYVDGVAYEG